MFLLYFLLFFFNATATTAIYTLSLHDALPILLRDGSRLGFGHRVGERWVKAVPAPESVHEDVLAERLLSLIEHFRLDRKSTRLNSSHVSISYAVFCLKKKKNTNS